jgi:hypothetical protein
MSSFFFFFSDATELNLRPHAFWAVALPLEHTNSPFVHGSIESGLHLIPG